MHEAYGTGPSSLSDGQKSLLQTNRQRTQVARIQPAYKRLEQNGSASPQGIHTGLRFSITKEEVSKGILITRRSWW